MYSCISTKKKFQRPQPPFHPRLPIQSLLLSPSHLSFPKAYRSWTILRISGAFGHLGTFWGPAGGRALEVSGLGRTPPVSLLTSIPQNVELEQGSSKPLLKCNESKWQKDPHKSKCFTVSWSYCELSIMLFKISQTNFFNFHSVQHNRVTVVANLQWIQLF